MKNPPNKAIAKKILKTKVKVFRFKFLENISPDICNTRAFVIEESIQKFINKENILEVVHLTQTESTYVSSPHNLINTDLTITMIYKT